jgi:hypothetical protein
MLILYDPNFVGNYRERPAVLLPEPSTLLRGGDHYQKEVLRWVLSFEGFLRSSLGTTVAFAGRIRDNQKLAGCNTKVHVELLFGTDSTSNRLDDLQAALPADSGRLCGPTDATMTAAEVRELRHRLADSVDNRLIAAGSKRLSLKLQIDHMVECWMMTWILNQFFGGRNLEQLDEQECYRLYDIVKKLHNSDKNAMAMSEVRNQRYVPISVLLGMGFSMADIDSYGVRACVKGLERHTHKDALINYTSGFEPLPWAVDAATMLEAFHSYATELYLIGEQQVPGSRLQRAVYTIAKWLFVKGDGARLTMPL